MDIMQTLHAKICYLLKIHIKFVIGNEMAGHNTI